MKNFTLLIVLCLFLGVALSPNSVAQNTEMPDNFIVYEEVIEPADVPAYEKIQEQNTVLFKKHGFDIPMYSYRTDDYSFYWVVPIKNFASMDELYEKYKEFYSKLSQDEEFDPMAGRDLYTQNQTIIHRSSSLSFSPDSSRQTENNTYCEWTFIYLKAQHGKEAAEVIKKYQEFYDSIEDSYQWDLYTVMIGQETPCWILMTRAESELALRQHEHELYQKHGEKFKELWAEFVPHARKIETRKGWFIPNWSLNWKME